jgi:NitT/TauT family transport system substrate-binding protein
MRNAGKWKLLSRTPATGLSRRYFLHGAGLAASFLAMPGVLRAQAKTSITVATAGNGPMMLLPHVALYKGIFAKHGLDATVTSVATITEPIPLLLSNRVQFAVTSPGMAINSTLQGGAIKIVANVVSGVPIWGVTRAAEPITTLDGLKGKRLATTRYPSSTVVIPIYAMKEVGKFDPDKEKVEIIELPGGQAQAVADGRADFAPMFEFFATLAAKQVGGLGVGLSFKDVVGPMAYSSGMCTADFASANPAVVQAFTDAVAETQRLLHSDRSAFIDIGLKLNPTVAPGIIDTIQSRFFQGVPVLSRTPSISKEDYDKDVKIELAGTAIKRLLPYEQMVDNSFAAKSAVKFA